MQAHAVRWCSRVSETTAAEIWKELLAGEWVVVERRDADAQRTLVLRRATAQETRSHAFTRLERDVLALAMLTWSLKMIAAELNLSTSRVGEVLGRVRAKLGAPTHADLLRMVGSFGLPVAPSAAAVTPRRAIPPNPTPREKSLPKRPLAAPVSRI
jgi:DNA-binding NarL/FixJ family response regulator